MKYKAGDKVRVKKFDERPEHWNEHGKMDKYMGSLVTIEDTDKFSNTYFVYDTDVNRFWCFDESDFEEITIITKDNLETGMIVEYRDGSRDMVIKELNAFIGIDGFMLMDEYENDLRYSGNYTNADIMKVFTIKSYTNKPLIRCFKYLLDKNNINLTLIWEREEPKEMTIEEVEQELGYQVKIVEEKKA